jgi:hypothetical protein
MAALGQNVRKTKRPKWKCSKAKCPKNKNFRKQNVRNTKTSETKISESKMHETKMSRTRMSKMPKYPKPLSDFIDFGHFYFRKFWFSDILPKMHFALDSEESKLHPFDKSFFSSSRHFDDFCDDFGKKNFFNIKC